MAKAPRKFALDIFRTLRAVNDHDMSYYDSLNDDEKKGYDGLTVMRWASATDTPVMNEWCLAAVNDRANMYHFDLYGHDELQYKLLASTGIKRRAHHKWIAKGKNPVGIKIAEFVGRYYPHANEQETQIVIDHLLRDDNLKEFLNGTGLAPDEIKSIQKLFAALRE